jgi:hypothetical protein
MLAFNGTDLRSCQFVEEGSCFNIVPAIKRSRFKELNPRRRVYVETPKPSKVELRCSQNLRR